MLDSLLVGLFFLFGLWLVVLSVWVYRIARHRLGQGERRSGLPSIEDLLVKQQKTEEGLEDLEKKVQTHIQKVGLVRFNPFGNTGGNQSFALALLDDFDSGIMLLSLHSRDGTRVYIKPVKKGKSQYQLSDEEKKALEGAKNER